MPRSYYIHYLEIRQEHTSLKRARHAPLGYTWPQAGMAINEAQRWRKIWFGQSREWSTAGMGTSFIRWHWQLC